MVAMDVAIPYHKERFCVGYGNPDRFAGVDVPTGDDVRIGGGSVPGNDTVRGGELLVPINENRFIFLDLEVPGAG
jgi:hypothetical protein